MGNSMKIIMYHMDNDQNPGENFHKSIKQQQ